MNVDRELAAQRLDHLWVIYPGKGPYELDERISVLPVGDVPSLADRISRTSG